MALFSFRHSVKTFSQKRSVNARIAKLGQTAAHLRYITRPNAARIVLRDRLTHKSDIATATAAEEAAQKRAGRVCERFIIALPSEATKEQRVELTRAFAENFTHGIAGYVAAIHDKDGNDLSNPHFHLVAFDVMQKTGGRGRPKSTLGMARKNAVQNTARAWADLHNSKMREWGYGSESMISHLSYLDRGIDRVPTIHEGPGARAMTKKKKRPKPKAEWRGVDEGRTRSDANKIIHEINKTKEQINERNQLGRNDDTGRAERQVRFNERGEGRGRCSEASGTPAPPFAAIGCSQEGTPRTGKPPFAPSTVERNIAGRRGMEHRSDSWATVGGAPRRGRVRRVFRELIWLRDTLRARLLLYKEQSRTFLPFAPQQSRKRAKNQPQR